MTNLNIILASIEKLEVKRDNHTITFEEASIYMRLVELAENLATK